MTVASAIAAIACFWFGVWASVLWTRRDMTLLRSGSRQTLDCHMEVLRENSELILRLAATDREVAQLKADLADAYDVIAIQHLMFGPRGKQKEAVH